MRPPSTLEERVLQEITKESVVRRLKELVNIPSPTGEEKEMARYLTDKFAAAGMRAELQDLGENGANAVGFIDGNGKGYSLLFNGHMDTSLIPQKGGISIKGSKDSGLGVTKGFTPQARLRDGRVYGIGAGNMKGGLAAFTIAVEAIAKAGVQLLGDLVVTCVSGEILYAPVDGHDDPWMRGFRRGSWYAITHGAVADMAIVAEPSGQGMIIGHPGVVWAKISTRGVSVNTVFAQRVPNPILRMNRMVQELERWIPQYQEMMVREYPQAEYPETEFQGPAVRIAAIQGGSPWRLARSSPVCSVYLDFRTKQKPSALKRELLLLLNRLKEKSKESDPEFNFEVDLYLTEHGDFETKADHILPKTIETIHAATFRSPLKRVGHRAMDSDATVMSAYGIPAVNYGPGYPKVSGGIEWVETDELLNFAKAYASIALRICNTPYDVLPGGRRAPEMTWAE